jgi:hypothetical protein
VTLAEAKQRAVGLLEREYHDLEKLFDSLAPEQLERPVFAGEGPGWRVRDLIAHFAYWQTMSARTAEKIAADGGTPDEKAGMHVFLGEEPGTDARNDENFQAWRGRPIADARHHLLAAHSRLMDAIRSLPPERIVKSDTPEDWYRYFWQPGVNHLRQHRPHIEAAVKENATT